MKRFRRKKGPGTVQSTEGRAGRAGRGERTVAVAVRILSAVILLCALAAGWWFLIPTKAHVDPVTFYLASAGDRYPAGAGAESLHPVILNGRPAGFAAGGRTGAVSMVPEDGKLTSADGELFLRIEDVAAAIDPRFFLEGDEVRYAAPEEVLVFPAEPISVSRLCEISRITVAENENGILSITTEFSPRETALTVRRTALRCSDSPRAKILTDLPAGERVTIIEETGRWTLVQTEGGLSGYVKKGDLASEREQITETPEHPGFAYSHLSMDEAVMLGWHYVDDVSYGLDSLKICLDTGALVNVVSPTWFMLEGDEGNFRNHADPAYTAYAHERGIQVWVLVENMTCDPDLAVLLGNPENRTRLIANLVAETLSCGADGINVDLESVPQEIGPAYLEFIRELSASCRREKLYLSVDNYVPKNYNRFYNLPEQAVFVDYVVIMGYDEHYAGQSESGPTASLGFVTDAVQRTVELVGREQTVLAVPFYSRLWKWTPEALSEGKGPQVKDAELGACRLTSTTKHMIACAELEAEHESAWDETLGLSYMTWEEDGCRYEIWPEDCRSMETRLAAAAPYEIAGFACWRLGTEPGEVWDVIGRYLTRK